MLADVMCDAIIVERSKLELEGKASPSWFIFLLLFTPTYYCLPACLHMCVCMYLHVCTPPPQPPFSS